MRQSHRVAAVLVDTDQSECVCILYGAEVGDVGQDLFRERFRDRENVEDGADGGEGRGVARR